MAQEEYKIWFLNFFFERVRRALTGKRGRGRGRESQPGSTLRAEPHAELGPMTLGS